ncbi:hypothetical protein QCM11_35 [Bacillus phage QCM11]|uniref:Uncharacterized protein n=1 Tax=Bacillus phage QCM11 TaxID=1909400 RepID=A0A1I9S6Q0_9CAUD|nr:hypothetical protein H3008_gp35 [Bacillus phage QCM11]AOZ62244.1 hypothetical protein QCM11_35 [Bacillus phage QCM11]
MKNKIIEVNGKLKIEKVTKIETSSLYGKFNNKKNYDICSMYPIIKPSN